MRTRKNTLCKLECKKIFSIKTILLILICLGLNVFMWTLTYRETKQDQVYCEVVESYRGISNHETCKEISGKTEYYKRALAEHMQNSDAYARNQISEEEYRELLQDYKYAKRTISGWEKLEMNAQRFENMEKETYFFYDTSWQKVFQRNAQWIFNLLLIILIVPFFYMDQDSEYQCILQSFCHYKEVKKRRLTLAITIVVILQCVWLVAEAFTAIALTSFPDANATLRSLPSFMNASNSLTLLQALVIFIILKVAKRFFDILVLSVLSNKIQGKMQTTVIGICYLLATDWFAFHALF